MSVIWSQSSLLLSVVPLAILALSSCLGSAATNVQATKKQPEFTVSQITVTPKWLFIGDNATVSATVTNKGTADVSYIAVFKVDGQKAGEKQIELAYGRSLEVSFPIASAGQGNKSVAIGDSQAVANYYASKPYTIQYDDYFGQSGTSWGLGDTWVAFEPYGQVVRFTVAAKPFRVNKIWIGAVESLKLGKEKFTLNIQDNTGKILWTNDFSWQVFGGQWPTLVDFGVPSIAVDDDFYVEVVGHTPPVPGGIINSEKDSFFGLAYDKSNYETRSTLSSQGQPQRTSTVAARKVNWCIRVGGNGGPAQELYYDDGGMDTYKAMTDCSFVNSFTAPSYPFDLRSIQLNSFRDVRNLGIILLPLR
jgi:hypothetical protein